MNVTSHNKGAKFPAEPLTKDEVVSLMAACSRRAPTGKRDRAIVHVLWRGQLRISEALALKPADFDATACTLRILNGKGKKARVAVIDQQTVVAIAEWLAVRSKLGVNGHKPLFCTLKGERISSAQMRQKIKRLGRKAGITKRVHLHGLRHSGASELANQGAALLDIQHQLGHSSAATTDRYLHSLNPVDRVARLRSLTF